MEAFRTADTGTFEQSDRIKPFKIKPDKTDRIAILTSAVTIVRTFYVDELKRRVFKNDGEFLKKNYQETINYIYPIVVYPTDNEGDFMYEKGGNAPKGDVNVMPLILSYTAYSNIVDKNNIVLKKSDKKNSIKDYDLLAIPGEKKVIKQSGREFTEISYETTGDFAAWKSNTKWVEQAKAGMTEYNAKIKDSFADEYATDDDLIKAIQLANERYKSSSNGNNMKSLPQESSGVKTIDANQLPIANSETDEEQKALPATVVTQDSKSESEVVLFDPDNFFHTPDSK